LGRFQGILLEESRDRLVIEQHLRVRNPRREFGKVVVANGYLAVWFIFRRKWYDVGALSSLRLLSGMLDLDYFQLPVSHKNSNTAMFTHACRKVRES
jgi:hypothetical protein